ncbi:Mus7/MMS22 family-domain-containing protein [Kalaharituber pfeilii]|nr:Mus7/MMS22 family-domain-containing protein [Kalaharituber pfeilii]
MGWRNPETMITTLFDFFATNMLPNLRNEPDHGSPVFLQNLDKQIPLAPEESDRCFHLLLKVIAVGLTSMKTTTSTKKIRDYVFRLMPNHRRQYPKEEVLRVEHLTALRNHHDLLCTLYWASPPSCRPPLSAIRGLVDPKSSHIQACAVSIRAWSYLIRFQLHTDEDLSLLVPLMEWYGDLTDKILAQHNSCRAEATRQLEIEREKGNLELSEVDLEDTIRRNQRQLEGFLLEAVRALGRVMINMKGKVASVMKLLTPAATGSLFRSFNKLSHKLVIEGLDVVMLYLTACQHTSALPPQTDSIPPEQSTEESQDYGDWAGMEDLVIQGERKAAAEQLITIVYEPLFRMVSSVLGADEHPADILLVKMIDTWARVDAYLVQQGLKSWHVYLETYGRESWAYFRDTVQTRKYTAYYMSKVIELSKEAYAGNKTIFLRYWFRTLVERKSMLKYQHEYTNAILNCDPGNAVLENLPFAKGETGIYNITLSEFENRRMSLISSVLANMRISYDISSPSMAPCLRREYTTMLQSMMDSMRENYVCLQTQWTTSNTTISSAAKNDDYVLFVQQVVELLQQHTIDIVPVDKFFTDSSAFPLPATDPTYVIGKLRNYGLKLSSPRAHKQLTAFFQTVCERAAVDGQQEYLVDQLIRALTGEQERGGKIGGDTPPTLRAFFLHTVFPAYMECAYLPDQAGWILATPIIRAATHIISRIQEDVDSCGLAGAKSVISSLSVWLKAALMALTPGVAASWELLSTIMSPNAHIGAWHVLYILTMESLIPSLSILDWLLENTSEVNEEENEAGQYARWQRGEVIEFATLLIKLIASLDEYMDLWNNDLGPEMYDAGTLRYICRQLARGSGDTEQILRNYNVNVEDELTSKELEAIKAEYLTAVTSSLKHEWHATTLSNTAPPRSDPEWFFTRRGDLRIVSHASTGWWRKMAAEWNSQVEGDEVAGADDGKGVRSRIREVTKEFLRHAARTEVWGRVVKSARESVWQGEFGRGQRTRRRAERVVQEEMAMLFC